LLKPLARLLQINSRTGGNNRLAINHSFDSQDVSNIPA
jgi:hypothetical protein